MFKLEVLIMIPKSLIDVVFDTFLLKGLLIELGVLRVEAENIAMQIVDL